MNRSLYTLLIVSILLMNNSFSKADTIHGEDNRKLILNVKNENRMSPVAGILHYHRDYPESSDLTKVSENQYKVKSHKFQDRLGLNICSDHIFHNQKSAYRCTAFLIEKNKVMTAGHCLQESFPLIKDLTPSVDYGFRFSFKAGNEVLSNEDLYSIKKIIVARKTPFFGDFAVIELDRDVIGVKPLKLEESYFNNSELEIKSIGHQEGLLNLVESSKGTYKYNDGFDSFVSYYSNLDINSASSGSPVINNVTGKVVGMITSTQHELDEQEDYIFNLRKSCFEDFVYEKDIFSTKVQRINQIFKVSIDNQFQELIFRGRFEGTEGNPININTFYETQNVDLNSTYTTVGSTEYKLMSLAVLRYRMTNNTDSVEFLLKLGTTIDDLSMNLAKAYLLEGDETLIKLFN